ncbi:MAG: hypothetical protein VW801_05730 [Candidatus Puniceispirillum sp.]
MGNPAGNISPCGIALGGQHIGNIVKSYHQRLAFRRIAHGGGRQQHMFGTPRAGFGNLLVLHPARRASHFLNIGKFRHGLFQHRANQLVAVFVEQVAGNRIGVADNAVFIGSDNAGADTVQHHFGKARACIQLIARLNKLLLLGSEAFGHNVEAAR